MLQALVGQEIGYSDWMVVDQARIDLFAQATGDHQWIHTDPVRAAAGPFGATVAHGFLTLSLVPAMLEDRLCHRRCAHGRELRPEPRALCGPGARQQPLCAGASSCLRL
jgi:acyl dehydratase